MKKIILLLLLIYTNDLTAREYNFAVCNDGILNVRSEATTDSEIIYKLDQYETVDIIARTSEKTKIGNYSDYWYKISVNDIKGWAYGAFLDTYQKTNIQTFLDLIVIDFPDQLEIHQTSKLIVTDNKTFTLRQGFGCNYLDHNFHLEVFYKPKSHVFIDDLISEYNIKEVTDANPNYGLGSIYSYLMKHNINFISEKDNGMVFKAAYQNWASYITYDLAVFNIEIQNHPYIESVLFQFMNVWTDPEDPFIRKLTTDSLLKVIEDGNRKAVVYNMIINSMKQSSFIDPDIYLR
ncbi:MULTISPECIES: SH3 domain-containing protein [unclassified Oceanispirochaeta]|uniref:SH3 domain-containing protein n=1 Tax=unclassified Oceanispirochaeta TaxID=2635722 RepID=UPI000E09B4B4|nr:SH3 domain-containing protein [Oceanispirochaeta sp. M1]MBF9017973.1 SH3 domain-containing protein [Oceanispirochaeta sp. M2]NPD74484.1 SH3 domain-containing protein [Oceanispirochaeta sp. M1]RDG29692.1 SH3 domain-containing protein [Oceanispirochaeta sp. M1]